MIYIEAKRLVDLGVQHHVLNTHDGGILVYRYAGSDPEQFPEGWYLEDPEDIYHDIMDDEEGQSALIDALKEEGVDFAEEQQKIHRMMGCLDRLIDGKDHIKEEIPMSTITFKNKEELTAILSNAKDRANNELNQSSYNAAWLHGYADALKDVLAGLDVNAIFREVDKQYLLEDAERQLRTYFDIEDGQDEEDAPGEFQRAADTLGCSLSEACNPGSDYFLLDHLAERFADEQDCNVAENGTWQSIIEEYFEENSPKHAD